MSGETPEHAYVLDFDRTLFDTRQFWDHFAEAAAPILRADSTEPTELNEVPDPSSPNFSERLGRQALEGRFDELIPQLDGNYLFDDVQPFLEATVPHAAVSVFSEGHHGWQGFKRKLSGLPEDLPWTVVESDKGRFLRRNLARRDDGRIALGLSNAQGLYEGVTFVDDKARAFSPELLELAAEMPGLRLVQIVRQGQPNDGRIDHPRVRPIDTLKDLL